jgi:ubiquinone/menaquinone biosynthesis C-methylase UbiE
MVLGQSDHVARAYEMLAEHWDAYVSDVDYERWVGAYEKLSLTCLDRPKRILDLGCATGCSTWPWARRGYWVVGVDIVFPMIAHALRKRQKDEALSSAVFLNANWFGLPFHEQVFSHVVANFSILNLIEKECCLSFFGEIARVLEPGGHFFFDIVTMAGFKAVRAGVSSDSFSSGEVEWNVERQGDRVTQTITDVPGHTGHLAYVHHDLDQLVGLAVKQGLEFVFAFNPKTMRPVDASCRRATIVLKR